MEQEKPWETAKTVGYKVREIWQQISKQNGLQISISGLPALSSYSIFSKNALLYKTFVTQEFLKRGYLAGTILYASSAHDVSKFDEYAEILNEIYRSISDFENGRNVTQLLDGPICHDGFKRLN